MSLLLLLRCALVAAAMAVAAYFMFYRTCPPPTVARKRILIAFIVLFVVFQQAIVLGLGVSLPWFNWASSFTCMAAFVLLCGNPRRSIFCAIYYECIINCLDGTTGFYTVLIDGGLDWVASLGLLENTRLLALSVLFVAFSIFFWRTMSRYQKPLSIPFYIMTVIPPMGSYFVMAYYFTTGVPKFNQGVNVFGDASVVCSFLVLVCVLVFWLTVKFFSDFQAQEEAAQLRAELDTLRGMLAEAEENGRGMDAAEQSPEAAQSLDEFMAARGITRRERDVIMQAIEGKTNKEIGASLGVSVKTVETHLGSIYGKTNITSRLELYHKLRNIAR